jgi:hypothetical protein
LPTREALLMYKASGQETDILVSFHLATGLSLLFIWQKIVGCSKWVAISPGNVLPRQVYTRLQLSVKIPTAMGPLNIDSAAKLVK